MARKKTAAQQALKDMFESKLNTKMFNGEITLVHELNEMIGITEKYSSVKSPYRKVVKVVTKVKVSVHNYMPPEVYQAPPKRRIIINPDGTVGLYSEWDMD